MSLTSRADLVGHGVGPPLQRVAEAEQPVAGGLAHARDHHGVLAPVALEDGGALVGLRALPIEVAVAGQVGGEGEDAREALGVPKALVQGDRAPLAEARQDDP